MTISVTFASYALTFAKHLYFGHDASYLWYSISAVGFMSMERHTLSCMECGICSLRRLDITLVLVIQCRNTKGLEFSIIKIIRKCTNTEEVYCSGEYDLKSNPLCPMLCRPVFCLSISSSLFKFSH